MKTLKDLFLSELADMYDAEHRLVKAMPKMAMAATCTQLQKIIRSHLKETEGHVTKLEQVFECFGEKPGRKRCEATVGILEEGDEIAEEFAVSHEVIERQIENAARIEMSCQ